MGHVITFKWGVSLIGPSFFKGCEKVQLPIQKSHQKTFCGSWKVLTTKHELSSWYHAQCDKALEKKTLVPNRHVFCPGTFSHNTGSGRGSSIYMAWASATDNLYSKTQAMVSHYNFWYLIFSKEISMSTIRIRLAYSLNLLHTVLIPMLAWCRSTLHQAAST